MRCRPRGAVSSRDWHRVATGARYPETVELHKGIAAVLLATVAAGAAMKVTHRSVLPVATNAVTALPLTSAASAPPVARAASPVAAAPAGKKGDPGRVEGPLDARVALGRSIFFDETLSEPPGTSCASCHDPARGYAGDHGSGIGVAAGSRAGHFARRTTPSVLYLRFFRRFHFEWPEDSEHPEAYAGFFWDGRSSSIAGLVRQPLLNPDEMGNEDARQIAGKLAKGRYADGLRAEFDGAFDTPERTLEALGASVEAFLTSPTMAPFSSRFDAYVRGEGSLSCRSRPAVSESSRDPAKGNCAGCHTMDAKSGVPERSLFTDFGYEAVGVPRNRRLVRPPSAFDLGLCERHDRSPYTDQPHFCGSFRTPSLRNVALRPSFMHNGALATLRDVVAFYATRGTDAKRWYVDGAYDDLPAPYKANVNVSSPPYDHREGDAPALDDGEIDAVVAFLGTLTDEAVPR